MKKYLVSLGLALLASIFLAPTASAQVTSVCTYTEANGHEELYRHRTVHQPELDAHDVHYGNHDRRQFAVGIQRQHAA